MLKRFVIVTGISGAGKSSVLNILEDLGYFCADNLPVSLIQTFTQLVLKGNDEKLKRVALGVDVRSAENLGDLKDVFEKMREEEIPFEILYIDASDEAIVKRYKETRRLHPLAGKKGRIEDGLKKEREQLGFLKEQADYILDTSNMLMRELTRSVSKIFTEETSENRISLTILSFGFKYGIPPEADLVFDVRFLPNPYYIEELKTLSGNDPPVSDFVLESGVTKEFLNRTTDLIRFLVPHYIEEGKTMLVIAVGCTGGRHRSVAIANELYRKLKEEKSVEISIEHRDLPKDIRVKGM